jgi:hypothetical protein
MRLARYVVPKCASATIGRLGARAVGSAQVGGRKRELDIPKSGDVVRDAFSR